MSEKGTYSEKETQEEHHNYFTEMEDRVTNFLHDIPDAVHDAFRRHRRTAFERHPFLFSTLGLLGLVATWQGFEGLIVQSEFFADNPGLLLVIGLIVLAATGRLYRTMDN